jgi:hypothetical protein
MPSSLYALAISGIRFMLQSARSCRIGAQFSHDQVGVCPHRQADPRLGGMPTGHPIDLYIWLFDQFYLQSGRGAGYQFEPVCLYLHGGDMCLPLNRRLLCPQHLSGLLYIQIPVHGRATPTPWPLIDIGQDGFLALSLFSGRVLAMTPIYPAPPPKAAM